MNDEAFDCKVPDITPAKGKKGVQVAWNKGVPFSEESRRKMSESAKKRGCDLGQISGAREVRMRNYAICKFFTEVMI